MALNIEDLIGSMQHSFAAGERGHDLNEIRASLITSLGPSANGAGTHAGVGSYGAPPNNSFRSSGGAGAGAPGGLNGFGGAAPSASSSYMNNQYEAGPSDWHARRPNGGGIAGRPTSRTRMPEGAGAGSRSSSAATLSRGMAMSLEEDDDVVVDDFDDAEQRNGGRKSAADVRIAACASADPLQQTQQTAMAPGRHTFLQQQQQQQQQQHQPPAATIGFASAGAMNGRPESVSSAGSGSGSGSAWPAGSPMAMSYDVNNSNGLSSQPRFGQALAHEQLQQQGQGASSRSGVAPPPPTSSTSPLHQINSLSPPMQPALFGGAARRGSSGSHSNTSQHSGHGFTPFASGDAGAGVNGSGYSVSYGSSAGGSSLSGHGYYARDALSQFAAPHNTPHQTPEDHAAAMQQHLQQQQQEAYQHQQQMHPSLHDSVAMAFAGAADHSRTQSNGGFQEEEAGGMVTPGANRGPPPVKHIVGGFGNMS